MKGVQAKAKTPIGRVNTPETAVRPWTSESFSLMPINTMPAKILNSTTAGTKLFASDQKG